MFIQGLMWIVGFAIVFPSVYYILRFILTKLFPLTMKDMLQKELQKQKSNLEGKKYLLLVRKEEAVVAKDSIEACAEIAKVDKEIKKINKKLGEMNR